MVMKREELMASDHVAALGNQRLRGRMLQTHNRIEGGM